MHVPKVFSTSLDPVYRFGIPYQVKMGGLAVDMDAVAQSVWAKNHDAKISKASVQQLGMLMSALEHRIPELFFTNEQNPGEAVSAVKALALASAQGQKIYQITSANVGVLNGLTIGTEVKNDIAAAVEVGREVTVSEGMITVAGWSGVGYIISDPATGSGAYKISGGGNGGEIKFSDIAKTVAIIFSTLVVSAAVLAFIVLTAVLFFEKWVIATAAISLVLAWLLIRTSEFDNPNLKTALVDIFGNAASFAIGALFPHPLVTAIIFTLFYVMFDAYLLAKLWIDARKIDTYVIARLWIRARCYA